MNAEISAYDLHSTYLPAFKTAVVDGKAKGVMCSYNAVNGVPSCANKWLLDTVARGEWQGRTREAGGDERRRLWSRTRGVTQSDERERRRNLFFWLLLRVSKSWKQD